MISTLPTPLAAQKKQSPRTTPKPRRGLNGIEIIVFAVVLTRVIWMCC